jgi:hypothetical protein
MSRPIKRRPKRRISKSRKTRLDALVAEAVVDCYGEAEQITGLYTMMDSHSSVPFRTTVLGVPVTVERVDLNQREEIVAVCRRARIRQTVPILDVPLPSPDQSEGASSTTFSITARIYAAWNPAASRCCSPGRFSPKSRTSSSGRRSCASST